LCSNIQNNNPDIFACFDKQAAPTALIIIKFRFFYKQFAPTELKNKGCLLAGGCMNIGLLLLPLSYTPKSPEGDFDGCRVLKPLQGFGVKKKLRKPDN
jgi:hypothetical protein